MNLLREYRTRFILMVQKEHGKFPELQNAWALIFVGIGLWLHGNFQIPHLWAVWIVGLSIVQSTVVLIDVPKWRTACCGLSLGTWTCLIWTIYHEQYDALSFWLILTFWVVSSLMYIFHGTSNKSKG